MDEIIANEVVENSENSENENTSSTENSEGNTFESSDDVFNSVETEESSSSTENSEEQKYDDEQNPEGKEENSENKEDEKSKETKETDPNKIKLKINGKEIDYDLSDKNQLVRDLQISKAAGEKFQQAQQAMKEVQELAVQLKSNPIEVLKQLGLNTREIAETYLKDEYENDDLPEDMKELNKLRREKEAWQQTQKDQHEAAEKQHKNNLVNEHKNKLTVEITSALDQSKLPKNEHTLSLMAQAMRNYKCTPAEALPYVEQHMQGLINHFIKINDGDKLEQLLGPEVLEVIRKHHVKKVQGNSREKNRTQDNRRPSNSKKRTNEPRDLDDFLGSI